MDLFIIKTWLQAFFSKNDEGERGASLVEYALLVALIAVICIAAITFLGKGADKKLSSASSALE